MGLLSILTQQEVERLVDKCFGQVDIDLADDCPSLSTNDKPASSSPLEHVTTQQSMGAEVPKPAVFWIFARCRR